MAYQDESKITKNIKKRLEKVTSELKKPSLDVTVRDQLLEELTILTE